MSSEPSPPVEVAIWGTFDVANFGDLLFPRIFEHELKRRLPDARVRSYSPLGYLHPVPLDGGFVAEPLGEWTPERVRELGEDFDLVAIGGGEIIHSHDEYYAIWYGIEPEEAERLRPSEFFIGGLGTEIEATQPVAWHSVGIPFDLEGELAERVRRACAGRAYVSVRDELSRVRLRGAGVEREIVVAPDSAFLVDRVFPAELLDRRREYLRAVGSYPADGRPLVVQGSRVLLPHVDDIGRALAEALADRERMPIVLLEAGPCHGDGEFADAIAPYLPAEDVHRMGYGVVVEDIVAAIAGASGVVGISLHGSLVAFAHEVPFAILDLAGFSKLEAFAAMAGSEPTRAGATDELRGAISLALDGRRPTGNRTALVASVDEHFDRLAELAERSAERRGAAPATADALEAAERRYARLHTAFEARSRRLLTERIALSALVERSDASRLHSSLDDSKEKLRQLRTKHESARSELAATQDALVEAQAVLAEIHATKLRRYSAPLRRAYGRLRPRRG